MIKVFSIIICLISSVMTVDFYISLPEIVTGFDGLRLIALSMISCMSFVQIITPAVKTG